MPFADAVTTTEQLRTLYKPASKPSLAKTIDHLDEHCRTLIAHSTFMLIGSVGPGGCDVSPKGGPPGFVKVLDDHRLAIPDMAGNNRLDSIENLVVNGMIGLLFCVPGLDETLRINGRATVTTAPDVLDACPVLGVRPRVAVGVDVDEAFIHCAKALRRGSVWQPEGWPDTSAMPSIACMYRDHYGLPEMDLGAVERRLDESYSTTMWLVGGIDQDDPATT